MPAAPVAKPFPTARPVRLGVAARLVPVKGIAVILRAVAELRSSGMDVELHIAGTGAERERLVALAAELGVDESVRVHGLIDDMGAFFRDIDCLLHVPLTEAFGLVTIEAGAQGCPAIVAAVDGLPEAVEQGVSGRCLEPTLSLTDYAELAGADYGIPARVYDPFRDELMAPKAVDPAVLADAVLNLFSESSQYERLSRSASEHVLSRRRFDRHVDEVMTVVNEFVST